MKTISIYIHKYISMKNMIKWYLNIILLKYVKKIVFISEMVLFQNIKKCHVLIKKGYFEGFLFYNSCSNIPNKDYIEFEMVHGKKKKLLYKTSKRFLFHIFLLFYFVSFE